VKSSSLEDMYVPFGLVETCGATDINEKRVEGAVQRNGINK